MKILLIIGTSLLFFIASYSQEKFAIYENPLLEREYDIKIHSEKKDKFDLYIDAFSLDRLYQQGGIQINKKHYENFFKSLQSAKEKYIEWQNTAQTNNVNDLNKRMDIKCNAWGYFKYGNWQVDYDVPLEFWFKITEKGNTLNYYLLVYTGEMQSVYNQFMKVDGVALAFSSQEKIQDFLNKISKEKIEEFLSKPKPDDLFK